MLQMVPYKILSQLFRRADWEHLVKADILAVRHDGDCGQLIDGKYYSPLIDSILDEVRASSVLTVASPYSFRDKADSYAGALNFNGAFARERLVNGLRQKLSLQANATYVKTWRRIIQIVRPKYVIGIQPHAALCRACHEHGVLVFDMQHGYIGPKHPEYGGELQLGRDRREMVDRILCWDEESAASIRDWTSKKRIEVRVIGNPWINKFATRREDDKVIQFFENQRAAQRRHGEHPRILVSLQWGLDDPAIAPDQAFFDNEFMPSELEKAIRNTRGKCDWILRPHPVQYLNLETIARLTSNVKGRFGSDVRVSENEPLPFVLSDVDLHITYSSSVVIEAAHFGVPSALLDPQIAGGIWDGYYASQISRGIATLLPCKASAIQDWISLWRKDSDRTLHRQPVPEAYVEFLEEIQGRRDSGVSFEKTPCS
jgi:hypothetical protein